MNAEAALTAPVVVAEDDPRAADVQDLIRRHLALMHENTPPEDVFALDTSGLASPGVTFVTARRGGTLLAMGALKELDGEQGELKSMHTLAELRGQGIGRRVLDHLLREARVRGYRRVSLETGSMAAFAPAWALYEKAGFVECGAFGEYPGGPNSRFMTLEL
ncbi:MAG TPA: GNAT family N-acetyltransferase [Acidimicrobiales bacterium]|nr:GNAT family N-acetyltransferase [Acidimicrobiales bacterium]